MTRKRPRLLRRLARWTLFAALAWVVFSVLLVAALRVVPPPTSAVMMARALEATTSGEKDFRLDYRWVPLERIAAHLPVSVVAGEDQRFPSHNGFDVEAIRTALAESEDGGRLRGASTISQQVAKNLFLWNGRSFVRKGLEAYFTVLIETIWPKRRIVEVYLNIAEFGDGVYGVGAASARYFRTTPDRLDAHQSALLAAVLPSPRRLHADRPSAYVQRRAAWIQRQVRQLGGPAYVER
ncbi:monofunctional biosynthetic peptidoglycan transglycosylase [Dokdonella sp. MW10]|uniref:monofunctional biosynthetic peptidoglycan transglycosylase n=1 Tax=Dokdonella sp. MW10 TaxID=2992926 RepID=UPI003F7D0FF9